MFNFVVNSYSLFLRDDFNGWQTEVLGWKACASWVGGSCPCIPVENLFSNSLVIVDAERRQIECLDG